MKMRTLGILTKTFMLITALCAGFAMNAQTWIQKASMPAGNTPYYPYSFSIGGKLYVGGGYTGSATNRFFMYDPVTNVWTAKASMPNNLYGGAYFVINGKGY